MYRPIQSELHPAAIVFLPGRMATDDQYQSYARALASRGFIVAVHGWYSLFTTDLELAHDAQVIADWWLTLIDLVMVFVVLTSLIQSKCGLRADGQR